MFFFKLGKKKGLYLLGPLQVGFVLYHAVGRIGRRPALDLSIERVYFFFTENSPISNIHM